MTAQSRGSRQCLVVDWIFSERALVHRLLASSGTVVKRWDDPKQAHRARRLCNVDTPGPGGMVRSK